MTGGRDPRLGPHRLIVLALVLLVIAVFRPVVDHDYIHFDDREYVLENPFVSGGLTWEGVASAFTSFHAANWHPLTWLSHMLDVEIFGMTAGGHHLSGLLLHVLGTATLFLASLRLTGAPWQSAAVAALFGVHPLHVESVAWVAERKDVLSALFWNLTILAYISHVRHPSGRRHAAVVALFALALMAKPMAVTLPFVLLLLDWWPLGRLAAPRGAGTTPQSASGRRLLEMVREKSPLLALAAASSAITLTAQSGAMVPGEGIPLGDRVVVALLAYAAYLGKTLWPHSLGVFYPHPGTLDAALALGKAAAALLLLAALTLLAWRQRRCRPYLAAGWLWYGGTLVPVIGLVQVGQQALADRYTYLPLIGIFGAIAWAAAEVVARGRRRAVAWATVAAITALAMAARLQVARWRDTVTLFTHTAAVTDRNWLAQEILALEDVARGRTREAIGRFREVLRLNPGHVEAWNNLGVAYDRVGLQREAIESYREALRLKPGHVKAWYSLGVAQEKVGLPRAGIESYREAVRLDPQYAEAWNNLGGALAGTGRLEEAADCFRNALRIRPVFAAAAANLGVAYAGLERLPEAAAAFRRALELQPENARNWRLLGEVYERLGQAAAAADSFAEARRLELH